MENLPSLDREQTAKNLTEEAFPDSESRELFRDPATRLEFMESLEWEGFRDLLTHVNARVREIEPRDHTHDGEQSILRMATVADSRDKTQVLHQCFDQMAEYLHESDDEPEEKLNRLGLAVGAAIIYVHPFADGNGRTSRFMQSFLMHGTSDVEALEDHTSDATNWQLATKSFVFTPESSDRQMGLPMYDVFTGSREADSLVSDVKLSNEDNRNRLTRLLNDRVVDEVIVAALDKHIDWDLVDEENQDFWGIGFDKVADQIDDDFVDTLESLVREFKNSAPLASVQFYLSDTERAKKVRSEMLEEQALRQEHFAKAS